MTFINEKLDKTSHFCKQVEMNELPSTDSYVTQRFSRSSGCRFPPYLDNVQTPMDKYIWNILRPYQMLINNWFDNQQFYKSPHCSVNKKTKNCFYRTIHSMHKITNPARQRHRMWQLLESNFSHWIMSDRPWLMSVQKIDKNRLETNQLISLLLKRGFWQLWQNIIGT